MNRYLWKLNRWLERLAWPGVVGCGLLVCSGAFYYSGILPLRSEIARGAGHPAATTTRHQAAAPEAELSDFYGFFPHANSISETLAKFYKVAETEGLQLTKGEYRLDADSDGKIVRYHLTFPLKGSYVQVRRFIASVLNEVENLSLDDVRFEKQRISDTVLDAEIKMTLYLSS